MYSTLRRILGIYTLHDCSTTIGYVDFYHSYGYLPSKANINFQIYKQTRMWLVMHAL